MATEKEANKAREQHSKILQSLGVHSLGVAPIGKKGSKNFGVIAYVEMDNKNLPSELIVTSGKKKVKVPVISKTSGKFKLE